MPPDCKCKRLAGVWAAVLLCLGSAAGATEVNLVGVVPGKAAIMVIDGAAPRTVRIGQALGGLTVISVDKASAMVEIDGKRRTLPMGQHVTSGPSAADGRRAQAVLAADARGHFLADALINGKALRVLVDTGATLISLPGNEARRMGIDFSKGQAGHTQTANGPAPAFRIKLDSVKVGDIELFNVDALVLDGGGLGVALLGMSFLNRVEMRRSGESMTLVQRY
jgi:aspartyl protease family protein